MDLSVPSSCSQVYFSTNAKKAPFFNLHFPEMVLVSMSIIFLVVTDKKYHTL